MISPIINQTLTYYDDYETFCYQNCIRQILEYYGISNADLCINACLSIVYKEFEDGNFRIRFDSSAYGVLPSLQSNVIRANDIRDNKIIRLENLEYIKQDYPLILTVDSYYLNYLPFYKKSHGRHTIILAGEEKEHPYIIDWQAPWFFKGLISYEELFNARNSINQDDGGIFSGKNIQNNWAYIKKDGWNINSNSLIEEFFDETKKQLYKDSNDGMYYGIYALEQLKKRFENVFFLELDKRKLELKKLYNSLYWPSKKRKFFQYYIELIIKKNISRYDCISLYEHVSKVNNEWDKLLVYILKSSFTGKDDNIKSIIKKIAELIDEEKKLYEMIY